MEIWESLWCIGGSLTKVRAGTSHPFFSTFHFQEIFKFLDFLCTTWKFCNNQWIVVFRKHLLSKKLWMKVKCESLASLPAPLPSQASICLPLPLPATGVHTFKQGCMSFIQRAVQCVSDIYYDWNFVELVVFISCDKSFQIWQNIGLWGGIFETGVQLL